jgi:hypothetical protein
MSLGGREWFDVRRCRSWFVQRLRRSLHLNLHLEVIEVGQRQGYMASTLVVRLSKTIYRQL